MEPGPEMMSSRTATLTERERTIQVYLNSRNLVWMNWWNLWITLRRMYNIIRAPPGKHAHAQNRIPNVEKLNTKFGFTAEYLTTMSVECAQSGGPSPSFQSEWVLTQKAHGDHKSKWSDEWMMSQFWILETHHMMLKADVWSVYRFVIADRRSSRLKEGNLVSWEPVERLVSRFKHPPRPSFRSMNLSMMNLTKINPSGIRLNIPLSCTPLISLIFSFLWKRLCVFLTKLLAFVLRFSNSSRTEATFGSRMKQEYHL